MEVLSKHKSIVEILKSRQCHSRFTVQYMHTHTNTREFEEICSLSTILSFGDQTQVAGFVQELFLSSHHRPYICSEIGWGSASLTTTKE